MKYVSGESPKIGDEIIGTPEATQEYSITKEGWRGIARTLSSPGFKAGYRVDPEVFKLISRNKKEVSKMKYNTGQTPKVGDKVIGSKFSGQHYGVTKEGWRGEVAEITRDDEIRVVGKNKYGKMHEYYVNPAYFDHVSGISLCAVKEKLNPYKKYFVMLTVALTIDWIFLDCKYSLKVKELAIKVVKNIHSTLDKAIDKIFG